MGPEPPSPPPPVPLAPGLAALARAPRLSWWRALLLVFDFLGLLVVLAHVGREGLALALRALPDAAAVRPIVEAADLTSGVTVVAMAGYVLVVVVVVLAFERAGGPSFRAMGLRREGTWRRETLLGLALGPLLFASILGLELAAGWARLADGSLDPLGALYGTLTFVGVAFVEEVIFRGFLLQVISRASTPLIGILLSALAFGAGHAANPAASPAAVLALAGAGLVFVWAYLATGRLWLPMALHLSWNLCEGPLYGFPVSGFDGEKAIAVSSTGPAWATGGPFGPEAGLVGVLACVAAAALIYLWRRAAGSVGATATMAVGAALALAWLAALALAH